jgi:hypothetical protein
MQKSVIEIGTSTGGSGLWFCMALDMEETAPTHFDMPQCKRFSGDADGASKSYLQFTFG